MYVEKKVSRKVTKTVQLYFAEEGDIITIPNKDGYWLVEDAKMTGGGWAHNDSYPDAWHVTARKLVLEWDNLGPIPKQDFGGQVVKFTQHTNSYNNVIEGVEMAGRMRKTYTFSYWGQE